MGPWDRLMGTCSREWSHIWGLDHGEDDELALVLKNNALPYPVCMTNPAWGISWQLTQESEATHEALIMVPAMDDLEPKNRRLERS
jgi:hypothetical protein